jgi:hypothetical protein
VIIIFDISEIIFEMRHNLTIGDVSLYDNIGVLIPNSERDVKEFTVWTFQHYFRKNHYKVMHYVEHDAYRYLYDQIANTIEPWFTHFFRVRGFTLRNIENVGVLSFILNGDNLIIAEDHFDFW